MTYRCVIENGSTKVIAIGTATGQSGQQAGDNYQGIGAWSAYTHATIPVVEDGYALHEIDGELQAVLEPSRIADAEDAIAELSILIAGGAV